MYCVNCAKELIKNQKFCGNCGYENQVAIEDVSKISTNKKDDKRASSKSKKIKGYLYGFIVFVISWKLIGAIVIVIIGLIFNALGKQLSGSGREAANINATATYIGAFVGVYLATLIYKRINK